MQNLPFSSLIVLLPALWQGKPQNFKIYRWNCSSDRVGDAYAPTGPPAQESHPPGMLVFGCLLWLQMILVVTASKTVAAPEAVSVCAAPSVPTSGPPIAVPSGVATMMMALRAASIVGR